MIEEKNKSLHQISNVLCRVYQGLVSRGDVTFELQDRNIKNIDSVVKTVQADYFGELRFPEAADKAAAYFCLIIKDHPVTDGNKRLAVLFLRLYCNSVGLTISLPKNTKLDQLAIAVEKYSEDEDIIMLTKRLLFG